MKESRIYLIHIRDCLDRIKSYTVTGKNSFYEQTIIQDAVLRNLEVMCESIKQLPDEWKGSEPDTPWRNIVGFRNRLAHQYLSLDLDIIWDIVENYLPGLEIAIENLSKRFWEG